MKRTGIRVCRAALVLLLAFVFTACSAAQNGAGTQAQNNASGAQTEAEAGTDTEADAGDGAEDTAEANTEDEIRDILLPENYDTRMEIWEHPAGASPDRKETRMHITGEDWQDINQRLSSVLIGPEFADIEGDVDTYYNGLIVGHGLESETFDDIPYLIPYLVRNAFGAVIIIPGGGFAYKTMYGHSFEAGDVARALNRAGYSAFVLNYRSNPYEYPVPQLDVQRAVRFVRAHAEEYTYPADNIGLIGFSAGGFQTAFYVNVLMGQDMFPEGYQPDAIDKEDDTVQHAALIYPLLSFRQDVPMLFCLFDAGEVRDEARRAELLDETDMALRFSSEQIPQFLAYGLTDRIVGTEGARAYVSAARKNGATIAELTLPDQGHLFGQEYYMDAYLGWLAKQ